MINKKNIKLSLATIAILSSLSLHAVDTSTATFVKNYTMIEGIAIPATGIVFNGDGTKLFVASNKNNIVMESILTTAYDISTANKAEKRVIENSPEGIAFNGDGTVFYSLVPNDGNQTTVLSYSLDKPYEIDGIANKYDENKIHMEDFLRAEEKNILGLSFNSDGRQLFVVRATDNVLVEYTLEKAYDFSRATYAGEKREYVYGRKENAPLGVSFSRDSSKMFTVSSTKQEVIVSEYQLKKIANLSIEEAIKKIASYANDSKNEAPIIQDYIDAEVTGVSDENLKEINSLVASTKDEKEVDTRDKIQDLVDSISKSRGAYNISGAVFIERKVLEISKDIGLPTTAMTFNGDGTKLFLGSDSSDTLLAYTLKVAYDVSSISEVINKQEVEFLGAIAFNGDGSYFYAYNTNDTAIITYPLSIPYDIGGRIEEAKKKGIDPYDNKVLMSKNLREVDKDILGLSFNHDGTKLFIVREIDNAIVEYTLGKAYDFSTASYAEESNEYVPKKGEASPLGLAFNGDGSKLFTLSSSEKEVMVSEYQLSGEVDTTKANAIKKISSYADGTSKESPTLQDYIDAGVTGVTAKNLTDVNSAVEGSTGEANNTTNEIQATIENVINPPVVLNLENPDHIKALGIPKIEASALVDLFNSTNGANWKNNANWNSVNTANNWSGVSVVNGHVSSINLSKNTMVGTLPDSLGNLSELTSLQINDNSGKITGSIPLTLANLTKLNSLNIRQNGLTGAIPNLSALKELTYLNLGANTFDEEIPTWIAQLTKLKTLDLYMTGVKGAIPDSILGMTTLTYIDLYGNKLTGTISSKFNNLIGLTFLRLGGNQFIGSVPDLSNLVNLKTLNIEHNKLSGLLSKSLFPLKSLAELYIRNNNYTFQEIESSYSDLKANASRYLYEYQNYVDSDRTLTSINEGNTLTITPSLAENSSGNDIYKWFKDGKEIVRAVSRVFTQENVMMSDKGVYTYEVRNSVVEGLILRSHKAGEGIQVNILNLVTGMAAVKDDIHENKDGIPATAEQINSIDGVSNALTGIDYSDALEEGTYRDDPNPTAIEIQEVIDAQNATITIDLTNDEHLAILGVSKVEVEALQSLYNNTNGTGWTNSTNWDTLSIVGGWKGITLSDGHVKKVVLNSNNLTNTIPSELGNLSELTYLNLTRNQLIGSIPDTFGGLTKLGYGFTFDSNNLTGAIPASLSTLISSAPSSYFHGLDGFGNKFTFSDMESSYKDIVSEVGGTHKVGGYDMSEQQAIEDSSEILISGGNKIEIVPTLAVNPSGNDVYQWYLNNKIIDGAISRIYIKEDARQSDEGNYTYTVTNTVVTDVILRSHTAPLKEPRRILTVQVLNDAGLQVSDLQDLNITDDNKEIIELTDNNFDDLEIEVYKLHSIGVTSNFMYGGFILKIDILGAVKEDIAGNKDGIPATAEQINLIDGVSNAIKGVDYSRALAEGVYVDPENPTSSEIQTIIDETVTSETSTVSVAVNSVPNTRVSSIPDIAEEEALVIDVLEDDMSAVIDDILGNTDSIPATATQINAIEGVSGAREGVNYSLDLENGTFINSASPTAEEIQVVIDAHNVTISGLEPIKLSVGGEEEDADNVVHELIEVPVPISDGIEETTLSLVGANEQGELVVEGEGVWSINEGSVVFTPEATFVYDPTPISYTMESTNGTQLEAETIEVHYPGLLRSDVEVISDLESPVIFDILKNDNGDLNVSTLAILLSKEFIENHPDATFQKSVSDSGKILNVPEQGVWSVNVDGTILYTPLTTTIPMPIEYQVFDNAANKMLKSASITISKKRVAGVTEVTENSDSDYKRNVIPVFTSVGLGLSVLFGTLFGLLFFRKEKN